MLVYSSPRQRRKNSLIYFFMSLVFLGYGAFMALDAVNVLYKLNFDGPGFLKIAVSLICSLIVWTIGTQALDKKDHLWLSLAFIFSFVGDVLVQVAIYFYESNTVFTIGGIAFIVMHAFLIIRHGRGFKFMFNADGSFNPKSLIFPAFFFIPGIVGLIVFAKPLMDYNLFYIAIVYMVVFSVSLWVAWEPLRQKTYPVRNAWMIALGMTSFVIMEFIGVVYNVHVQGLDKVAFMLTWVFYGPFLVLLPFSGFQWEE